VVQAELAQSVAQLHSASYAWALACTRWNSGEAEEVLQSAYVRVLEGRAVFSGRSSFKTWLFSVVRNVAADRRRRRWLEEFAPWKEIRGSGQLDAAIGPLEALESEQAGAQVRGALGMLAARQREVLELVFFHQLTVEEAATVMGVRHGTARVHYHRGKLRLLTLLKPEDVR
jgi:RNA polymerase sigma factor (sigma-70 family)